ncbi:UNVERIFIED_CONTAM: protein DETOXIFICATION 49 [Sesamum angustifolium]|uniref:Protein DETOXIFICATION 49 n=1 Tax=Sesamum angustifolium TaxID=2727405 RepID=A0AAW2LF91_9LAMI
MDFEGLWLGLAAQACMVTMMVVLLRTDWEFEARRAEELTGGYEILDENEEVDDEKDQPIKAENKGDCLC